MGLIRDNTLSELKAPVERDETYITKVADVIKASGMMDKVIVSGFGHSLLRDLKNYLPELKVGVLMHVMVLTFTPIARYLC